MFQTVAEQMFDLRDQGYSFSEIAEMTNTTVEFVVDRLMEFQEIFLTGD